MKKFCEKCGEVTERYSCSRQQCKICARKRSKKYYNENREKRNEYNRNWARNNRERSRKQKRDYYHRNREEIKKQKNVYRKKIRLLWYEWLQKRGYYICKICGYYRSMVALDYHHLNPKEKEFSIGYFITHKSFTVKNALLLQKELEKCETLCSNCHRELHFDKEVYENVRREKNQRQNRRGAFMVGTLCDNGEDEYIQERHCGS